jgi:hypothetical protein
MACSFGKQPLDREVNYITAIEPSSSQAKTPITDAVKIDAIQIDQAGWIGDGTRMRVLSTTRIFSAPRLVPLPSPFVLPLP